MMSIEVFVVLEKEVLDKSSYFSKVSEVTLLLEQRPHSFKALVTEEQLAALEADPSVVSAFKTSLDTGEWVEQAIIKPVDYKRRTDKGSGGDNQNEKLLWGANGFGNWGLIRHTSPTNTTNVDVANIDVPFIQNYDGTGVDLILNLASVLDSSDPEFLNADGSSRINNIQWNTLVSGMSQVDSVSYNIAANPVSSHAEAVAYCACSNTYGWATGSEVYVFPRDQLSLTDVGWDLFRMFHEQKVAAGNTRPTIVVDSMGYFSVIYTANVDALYLKDERCESVRVGNAVIPVPLYTANAGATRMPTNFGMPFYTNGQLNKYFFYDESISEVDFQAKLTDTSQHYYHASSTAPIQAMIDAGVHHVSAAGNYQNTMVLEGHPCENDGYTGEVTATTQAYFKGTNIGNLCLTGDTIAVGAMRSGFGQYADIGTAETFADFSDRGERVDACAAGHQINMDLLHNGNYEANGTSFASPNVGGMACLVLEKYPTTTPRQLRKYFRDVAVGTDKLWDSGISRSDLPAAVGDPNFYADVLGCRGYSGNIAYLDPNLVFDPTTLSNDPIVSTESLTDVTIDFSVAEIQTKLDTL